jgi:Meiotically Up-regulated Gene 113 (MUG113) protein
MKELGLNSNGNWMPGCEPWSKKDDPQLSLKFSSGSRVGAHPRDIGIPRREVIESSTWLESTTESTHHRTHNHFDSYLVSSQQLTHVRSSGYIYFIEDLGTGLVKIGKTRRPLSERLKEHQTGNGNVLRAVLSLPSNDLSQDEEYYHLKFEADRKRGEWFFPSHSLREFLMEHGAELEY